MKHRWILLLLAVPVLLLGCEPTPDTDSVTTAFRSDLTYSLTALEQDYTDYSPSDPRRDANCRKQVWAILARAETDTEHQAVSDELAGALAGSDTFRMFDNEVLAIGADTFRNYPPTSNQYLTALASKVNNAMADPSSPSAYRAEYASLAVGHLLDTINYPGTVKTYNDQVNHAQWRAFSTWLDANFDSLVYDPAHRCYHVVGRGIEDRTPTTTPTLDDPGR
jgi:hypothetical protein